MGVIFVDMVENNIQLNLHICIYTHEKLPVIIVFVIPTVKTEYLIVIPNCIVFH